jgi:hypothetical protein
MNQLENQMNHQRIKFKVSLKELSFEFEGSRDIGQALQSGLNRSLAQLLDTQRTVLALSTQKEPLVESEELNGDHEPVPENPASPGKTPKRPRRTGPNLAGLVRELKAEDYFKEPKTMSNIIDVLKVKGHIVKPNSLSGRLQTMAQNKELYRQQTDDGFVYKDSPFNESPGTQDPPVDPAN